MKWRFLGRYDPHATQFISFGQMSDFIASLDSPLGIPKPNILALVSFDLPIAKGDKIHCLDVLHSLTKYTLGFVDDGSEDFSKVSERFFPRTIKCLDVLFLNKVGFAISFEYFIFEKLVSLLEWSRATTFSFYNILAKRNCLHRAVSW